MNVEVARISPLTLERQILANIPLAAAMQISVSDYENGRLILEAPFAPSVNHAGIAFGGAIECLATLACWGLVWLLLENPEAKIVIQHGETSFRQPMTGTLCAEAALVDEGAFERFRNLLERRGRARIGVHSLIGSTNTSDGARFHGRFAVSLPEAAQRPAANVASASSGSKR